jgi:hypothetical protein
MMKILKAAALAFPLMGAVGAGAASAAPGNMSQTTVAAAVQGSVQSVGYWAPGAPVYVPTCRVFYGYDWYGNLIYRRVCG